MKKKKFKTKLQAMKIVTDGEGRYLRVDSIDLNEFRPGFKKKSGRPTTITPKTIDQLVIAFKIGATDEEACRFAGISTSSLYRYEEKHPEFREQKASYKQEPILRAKITLMKAIDSDVQTAKWYLERKARFEFDLKYEEKQDEQQPFAFGVPQNEKEMELLTSVLNRHNEYLMKKEIELAKTVD